MNECISIIVPAYNLEPYIEKTLASITAQTYQNLEIIVVNDGSKDRTGTILDEWAAKDARIKVIHKENGGVTSARLRGVAEATGEWIGFVDGDDYIEPQMYERLLGNAQKYDADISHCGYQMVFPKGHVDYYYNTGRLEIHNKQTGLIALLEGVCIEPSLCNKVFRRELFHDLIYRGVLESTIRNNEDVLMNFYLFREVKQSVYEDFCPYHYLLRPSSATTSGISEHKLKDPMKVVRILLKETEDQPELHAVVRRRYIRMLIQSATMNSGEQKDLIAPYRKEMRRDLRRELPKVLCDRTCSKKQKLMALWAGLWPDSYRFVHWMYTKIKGTDQIYSLDK